MKLRTSIPLFSAGFTFLEIVVVIGLVLAAGAFSIASGMGSYQRSLFRSDRELLLSSLKKARAQSISNMCFGSSCTGGKPHGVHIGARDYTLFQGADWASRDAEFDETVYLDGDVAISGSDVAFNPLSGEATPAVITISDSAGHAAVITISAHGRISTP